MSRVFCYLHFNSALKFQQQFIASVVSTLKLHLSRIDANFTKQYS